ncbi:hypothetical protein [Iodidimonas nitroreducens]|uniref:hypothetical protein n=1 Tax=Iodidimonas nitroreducens TaxID=1236968 RepID=UPI0028D8A5F3|nr:hypothetical protein [Iodidimonas nitroreducens]
MTTFKRIRMLCGTSSAMALALAINPVFAQQVDPADNEDETALEEIVVQGFRSSIENSIAAKRGNSSIVEAISAEDIGKLPDVSIAESLARLPGLTTQRLMAVGRFCRFAVWARIFQRPCSMVANRFQQAIIVGWNLINILPSFYLPPWFTKPPMLP